MTPDIEERIRSLAYFLWDADGRPEGRDKQYWERAERELAERDDVDMSEDASTVSPIPLPAGFPTH